MRCDTFGAMHVDFRDAAGIRAHLTTSRGPFRPYGLARVVAEPRNTSSIPSVARLAVKPGSAEIRSREVVALKPSRM